MWDQDFSHQSVIFTRNGPRNPPEGSVSRKSDSEGAYRNSIHKPIAFTGVFGEALNNDVMTGEKKVRECLFCHLRQSN